MKFNRSAGILLHPTSLPGPDGIGSLGPEAYAWVQFLADSGIRLWQVLPLGQTGYGDSPYQCLSAFAGNTYLISPALLLDEGLLTQPDLADRPSFPVEKVDFPGVIQWKTILLERAYNHFKAGVNGRISEEFDHFLQNQSFWLDDYALFATIKTHQGGGSWVGWSEPLRMREPDALAAFKKEYGDEIHRTAFFQFLFFRQWARLKAFANSKGISIIGDIPIFISHDSADVWSKPELFSLDTNGNPTVVAGVPPDYFSPTGQLWGNPHYRWDVHQKTGYAWWIQRVKSCLNLVDYIRLDHFRGFAGYWEVPANLPTAEIGVWKKGPGAPLFEALRSALGDLPIIAEDLGKITPDVVELRDHFQLPGMKILQFSFSSDPEEPFLPHNYTRNCVAYTGTHDNDTTIGWFKTAPEIERDFCKKYLHSSGDDIAWDMIRCIWASVAVFGIAPMQDFLRLDTECRMNLPGRPSGNWGWRMNERDMDPRLSDHIRELNRIYGRMVD
jgi:4-alpha-glucanotransferase